MVHWEFHPDRIALVIVIFDFSFRQRGLFHCRPHNGLGSLVQSSVHQEFHEFRSDDRFGVVIHGEVRIVPLPDDAEALELLPLNLNPMLGEMPAFLPQLVYRHFVFFGALFSVTLLDFPFDRETMAIPSRHVTRVFAHHLLGSDDHVLENFVQRMSDVKMSVGVGRSVMKNEGRSALLFAQPVVNADPLPPFEPAGLPLRKARPHREIGFRKLESASVVSIFSAHRHLSMDLVKLQTYQIQLQIDALQPQWLIRPGCNVGESRECRNLYP